MRRGLTLHELLATMAVVSSILVMLGGSLGQVTTIRNETLAITSVRERGLRVRGAVERSLEGWPLRQLTLIRAAEPDAFTLRERDPRPGSTPAARWQAGPALVCRVDDGYRVLAVEGDRLWEIQLPAGQQARRRLVATRVSAASFQVARDAQGAMNGITYALTLSWPRRPDGSAPVLTGFVGLRIEAPPATTRARTVRGGAW